MTKTKCFTKATAVLMAVIMMFGVFGATAFASGSIGVETSGSGSSRNVRYNYTVSGTAGATSTTGIRISSDRNYTLEYSTSSVRAKIEFYNENNDTLYKSYTTPVYVSGMPSNLSSSVYLEYGKYYVVIRPLNSSDIAEGYFTINGVAGTYSH